MLDFQTILVAALFIVSVGGFVSTALQTVRLIKVRNQLAQLQQKFKTHPNYETQQFMADILQGELLFHIDRVPPESVFLRRD